MNTPTAKKIAMLLAFATALTLPTLAQRTNDTIDLTKPDDTVALTPKEVATTKPVSPKRNLSEDVVELETFTVVTDKDEGYLAVDALAGGRAAMELKFTPASMDAITKEFMEDFAIIDVNEALQWATNVVQNVTEVAGFNNWDYNFRGAGGTLQGGRGTKRNYNTFFQVADSYNTERFEIGLGPNSILYGVGGPGGNVSVYTKIPRLNKNFGQVSASMNHFGAYRFTLDYNQRLGRTLALRVNGLYSDGKGYRDFEKDSRSAGTLSILWKPTHRTQLRIEGEAALYTNNAVRSATNDRCSYWDGSTIADTYNSVLDPKPEGVDFQPNDNANRNNNAYWVYMPGNPGAGLQNYSKAYRTMGTGLKMAPYSGFYTGVLYNDNNKDISTGALIPVDPNSIPLLPSKTFTWGAGKFESKFQNLTIWFEHQFSPTFDMQIQLYRYCDAQTSHDIAGLDGGWSVDINKQLPDGTENPNFGKLYGDGQMGRQLQQREDSEARIQFNYRMKGAFLGIPYKQRFSFGASIEEMGYHAYSASGIVITLDPTWAWMARRIFGRWYIDDTHTAFNPPSELNGQKVDYIEWGNFDFDQTHKLSNAMLASHTMLWEDKLSVLAGVRYDDYSYEQIPKPPSSMKYINRAVNKTTYSVGGVYYMFGWLGFVGNYSLNCDPVKINANNSIYGGSLPPAKGESTDLGIRISYSKGNARYYANFNHYFGQQIDNQMGNNNGPIGFGTIWSNYYGATQKQADTSKTNLTYSDVQTLKLNGYEGSFTAQPTRSLSMRVSFSVPKTAEIVESMAQSRQYYEEHLAQWNEGALEGEMSGEPTAVSAASSLKTNLDNAKNTLDNNVAGMEKTGRVKYTLSGNVRYSFREGILKGFAAGMGVSYQAKRYNGVIRERKYYQDDKLNCNIFASYNRRIFGYQTSIQLNIDNAFNNDKAFITGYNASWYYADGSAVPNSYQIYNPISARISMRVNF